MSAFAVRRKIMNMQQHILAALSEQYGRWEELLTSLSEEQISTPLVPSHWSAKDVVAHLRSWQQRSIARVESVLLNRVPEYPRWPADLLAGDDVQGINAWLYETQRQQPWPEVHQNWREGFRHFLETSARIPERDLLDAARYHWLEGHPLSFTLTASYDHHREHLDALLAWLQEHGVAASG
jgi:hypothetical protein